LCEVAPVADLETRSQRLALARPPFHCGSGEVGPQLFAKIATDGLSAIDLPAADRTELRKEQPREMFGRTPPQQHQISAPQLGLQEFSGGA
jgi:hypothetical protein